MMKWLAAQEELHSSDEEEEDDFDIEALEKKRQKEIEEWRHQTLASGGALENANFQPLGTLDWYAIICSSQQNCMCFFIPFHSKRSIITVSVF